ncbi:MAG: PAS domain-containing protein, partial [Kordiimonadaceae bacterium]|nr:PAS domain-containing protein [Kordiimonadaceae bacterium]
MGAKNEMIDLTSLQTDHSDIILNSIADAIITVNSDNEITFVNVAAEQFLGSSSPILKRKKLEDIVP